MGKALRGALVAAVGLTTVLATSALAAGGNPDNPGARKVALAPTQGSGQDQCQQAGSAGGSNGFVIVNAPGKPDAAIKVNGEVSLKNDTPGNQVYAVSIAGSDGNCLPAGMLKTNNQGNGNAHIDMPDLTSGTYYVVLQDMNNGGNEKYATTPVTVR